MKRTIIILLVRCQLWKPVVAVCTAIVACTLLPNVQAFVAGSAAAGYVFGFLSPMGMRGIRRTYKMETIIDRVFTTDGTNATFAVDKDGTVIATRHTGCEKGMRP